MKNSETEKTFNVEVNVNELFRKFSELGITQDKASELISAVLGQKQTSTEGLPEDMQILPTPIMKGYKYIKKDWKYGSFGSETQYTCPGLFEKPDIDHSDLDLYRTIKDCLEINCVDEDDIVRGCGHIVEVLAYNAVKKTTLSGLYGRKVDVYWTTCLKIKREVTEVYCDIINNPLKIKDIYEPDEELCLLAVRKKPAAIEFIKDPCPEIQMAAVSKDPDSIRYIKSPTKEAGIESLKQNGMNIRFIPCPSQEEQIAAVSKNGLAIQYIPSPCYMVQLAAVENTGEAIRYIKDPGRSIQLAAVRQNGTAIQYIESPDFDVKKEAIHSHPLAAEFMDDIPEELIGDLHKIQTEAVKRDRMYITFMKNPCEEACMTAVNKGWGAIRLIKNPSEAVQMEAVRQSPEAIKYIKNQSKSVQAEALLLYRDLLDQEKKIREENNAIAYQNVRYVCLQFRLSPDDIHNPDTDIQKMMIRCFPDYIKEIQSPDSIMQRIAVENSPDAVRHIPHPDENTMMRAVMLKPETIKFIKNPTRAVQSAAVKRNGMVLEFIENPDRDIQFEAVRQDGLAIRFIKNPSKEIQLEAVRQNEWAIKHIKDPDREIQLTAVRQNGWVIQFIKDPDIELQREAVAQDPAVLELIKNPCREIRDLAAKYDYATQMTETPRILISSLRKKLDDRGKDCRSYIPVYGGYTDLIDRLKQEYGLEDQDLSINWHVHFPIR